MRIGGQEHFYLEGQIALAVPGEDDEVTVYSSTQHPSEIQHMVAKVLGVPRTPSRSRSAAWAAPSAARRPRATCSPASRAIVAKKTGRAAKCRPDRDDDMVDHRQAPRLRRRLRGRLRRRGPDPGPRHDLRRPLRLVVRPVRPGHRPRLFHADNCYWLPGGRAALAAAQDQHRSPTPPFAASAARRAWSAASG